MKIIEIKNCERASLLQLLSALRGIDFYQLSINSFPNLSINESDVANVSVKSIVIKKSSVEKFPFDAINGLETIQMDNNTLPNGFWEEMDNLLPRLEKLDVKGTEYEARRTSIRYIRILTFATVVQST